MADDIKSLADKYKNLGSGEATSETSDVSALAERFKNLPEQKVEDAPSEEPGLLRKFGQFNLNMAKNVPQGIADVGNTLSLAHANITQGVDRLFKQKIDRVKPVQENIDRVNKLYEKQYGDTWGGPVGRTLGQVAATAPFFPGRVAQGVQATMGAMPTVLTTGEKIAAPMVNRLGAASVTGGLAGGEFGALTSAANDKSLLENVGTNALGGLVGGPVLEYGGHLASKLEPAIRSAAGNSIVNIFARKYGVTPNSAKRVVSELDNEGITLAEAEANIISLGKEATIADLTPGLQKFAGALAQRGGRSTAIVENRFGQRAEMADDNARAIMETKLGPKPDIEAEKVLIKNEARKLTRHDYEAAYASPDKLSVYGLIGDINKSLESAAGSKANALKEAKGYLYKTTKDAQGNDVKSIKTSVEDLHEVRIALDDMIERMENPATTQGSRTLGAIKDVRAKVDEQLKKIPEMAAADAKFSEKMDIKSGLDIGYKALKSGNIEEFNKAFNAATPEVQETMRKGLRAAIGDEMEKAAKGELAGAQQLFKKRTVTREKLKTAFGPAGEEVLDALATQAVLRRTEGLVAEGSRTAVNLRINALLDNEGKPSGVLGELIKGGAIDLSTGASGPATVLMGAKRLGGNIVDKAGQVRKDANIESFADLISRSGKDLTTALRVVRTVDKVQKKIVGSEFKEVKLPVGLSGPVGEYIEDKPQDIYNKLKKWF